MRSFVGLGWQVERGSCWRGVVGSSPRRISPSSCPLSPQTLCRREPSCPEGKKRACLASLPPGGEIQTFPGRGAVLGLCFAFLPNLCLTARSSPSSHGALPSAARDQRGSEPFPVPTPKTQPSDTRRVLRRKQFSKPHLLGVKKNSLKCVGLSSPPFTTSYPLPPSLDPSD